MKKLITYAGGAVILIGSLGATSAMADGPVQGAPDCADQLACIYQHASFVGKLEHKGANAPWTNTYIDNVATSWANKTYKHGVWYMGFNDQQSECHSMWARSTVTQVTAWENDKMSSWRMDRSC